jgi:glycosyltransferase involved in cell wall biosynthesis
MRTVEGAPLVSVLINAYNAEPYLAECLDSVLAQTLEDFEVIVVDDGSSDATGQIAEAYARRDPRVRVYHNERNLGIPATINRALAHSRGEFIAKMDADDVTVPERFAKQVAYLRAHPEVVMVGGWWSRIEADGRELGGHRPRASNRRLAQQMLRRCVMVHPTVMVRGDLMRRIKYREFFRYAQDYDLFLRLSEHGEIAMLPEVMVKARFNPKGVTVQRFHEQAQYARYARTFARQRRRRGTDEYERVAADPSAIRPFASDRASLGFYHYRRGLLRVSLRDMAGARREFRRSLAAVPWDVRVVGWFVLTLAPKALLEQLRRLMWRLRWGQPPK